MALAGDTPPDGFNHLDEAADGINYVGAMQGPSAMQDIRDLAERCVLAELGNNSSQSGIPPESYFAGDVQSVDELARTVSQMVASQSDKLPEPHDHRSIEAAVRDVLSHILSTHGRNIRQFRDRVRDVVTGNGDGRPAVA